jgi:tRNA pseudouridine38-40 synthase
MRTIMLIVEYDGTDYCGFQAQAHGRTIQGELETALLQVTGERIRVAGAGRTDAGAHALAQVVSFRTESRLSAVDLGRALNGVLSDDIAIKESREVPDEFHARRSALTRWYRYTIVNRAAPPAIERRFVHHVRSPLDVAAMDEACRSLQGYHDFRAFGTGRTTERRMAKARCQREGERVLVDLVANAFLTGMVRSVAGTLIRVGLGQLRPVEFGQILEQGSRALAGPTAPPKGLCLMAVYYQEAKAYEDL